MGGIAVGVAVGGSLRGSDGIYSAAILAKAGNLGPVKIGGDLRGGIGDYSGSVQAYGTFLGNKLVGGPLLPLDDRNPQRDQLVYLELLRQPQRIPLDLLQIVVSI